MVAVTSSKSDNALNFKNVFGFLKLQFKSTDEEFKIKSITIKGNNDEKLSGTATINCSAEGTPTIEFGENAGNSITLECNNIAINAATATDFWIALPPVSFNKGITVEIVTSAATIEKKTSAPLTITRSKVKPMEELTTKVEVDYTTELDIPDLIWKITLKNTFDMNNDGILTLYDVEKWNNSPKRHILTLCTPSKYSYYEGTRKVDKINAKEIDYTKIRSIKGIEKFSLDSLIFENDGYNEVVSSVGIVDLVEMKSLRYLNTTGLNRITLLNVKGLPNLEELYCSGYLSNLDLSGCSSLKKLRCGNRSIINLNVSGCYSLEDLDCRDNHIGELDLSSCYSLKEIDCYGNELRNLILGHCGNLTDLYCQSNQLTILNTEHCTALTKLYCDNNNLTSLDLSNNKLLSELICKDNELTSLDLSKNTNLKSLNCKNNQLKTLDISNNPNISSLNCNMPTLQKLYIKRGHEILGITSNRIRYDCINDNTEIVYVD